MDGVDWTKEVKVAYKELKAKVFDDALSEKRKLKEWEDFTKYVFQHDWHVAFDEGEYQKALKEINRVIKRKPNTADAYLHRAMTYVRRRDYSKAVGDPRRVLELDPANEDAQGLVNTREIREYEAAHTVKSLICALREFYRTHKSADAEILISVAGKLEADGEALAFSQGCEEYGDREIQQLIRFGGRVYPDIEKLKRTWDEVVQRSKLTLEGTRGLKVTNEKVLKEAINTFVDLGRKLLKAHEMKAAGKSDEEIQDSMKSWRIENVF